MALIRGHHSFDDHFTQIPNGWLRDDRLSLGAIGLLAQLMSHKPGWKITQENLARANNVGRDAIRTLINELVSTGYLHKSEKRERNSSGQLAGYNYVTSDPVLDEPTLAEPTQAEPTLVEPPLKKTITQNTIVKKTRKKRELTPLPDDFEPNPSVYDDPRWFTVDVDREVERFRNWALANDVQYKDWQAALRNWLDRAIDYQRGRVYKDNQREEEKRRLDEWLASQMEDDNE